MLIYDLSALLLGGMNATISRVVIDASYDWPAIPFAVGFLCGHLFFSMRARRRVIVRCPFCHNTIDDPNRTDESQNHSR